MQVNAGIELNHAQVMKLLPHRDPMLLIDEVSCLIPGQEVTATFYVDGTRDIFKGHFPGDPVLPGDYTVEATAQAADILLMSLDRYKGKTPLFLGIDNVRFKKKILPGDTLEIHVTLLSERVEKAIATCKATVYTNGDVAAESEVSLAMR
jgi:3-hydroxyacyl-[acyl-carrier-protein] dehydratase